MSFLRAAAITCLVLSLSGAELNLQSSGWSEHSGKDAKAVFTRIPGQVSISVSAGRYARMQAASPGDGTDAAPLRVETRLSITGDGTLLGQAGQLTLIWPSGLLSVGVIPGDSAGSSQRSAVARWVSGKERGERLGPLALNPHAAPAFLRLLVSTRDVSAWASADGWTWQRLVTLPREGGVFAGAPSTVAVGKGWPETKQGLSLDVDQAEPAQASIGTYIFQGFRAVNDAAVLPSALLKTYTKGASREETIDQLRAASLPREWWLTGPFPARAVSDFTAVGPEQTAFDPGARFASGSTQVGWKAHVIGDGLNDHIVMASAIIPGDKGQSRYAATVIESDEPRLERFLFDGTQRIALYVNGQLVAHSMQEEGRSMMEVDRQVVVAPLVKGRNTVVVMAASDGKGQATFTLRHEPGDMRYRIALLKRLAIEFPEDTEAVLADLQESARIWENLGFIGEAAKTSGEIAALAEAPRDQAETALFERIRLHISLRDQSSIDGDIEAIKALWSGDTEATPLTVLQRTAKLWQRLDQPDKALASLSEAARLASQDDEQSAVLGLERLRLISANHDPAAICSGMRDVANALPATSALRALLCSEIADRMLIQSEEDLAGGMIWIDDLVPAGGVESSDGGDSWTWVVADPTPFQGAKCHQSAISAGQHQHYFTGATQTLAVNAGDILFAYVYLDPQNPPSQVMLQWNQGTWEHRAYWGANIVPFGTDGTESRRSMGALPELGKWVRLEVPAKAVGLQGSTLNGMAFTLHGGRAWWDSAGKGRLAPAVKPAPPVWDKPDGELAIALASSNPRALRRAAGVALAAKQPALWLKALTAIAALPASGYFDAPDVTLAEALAVSGDQQGAMQAYRQAIAELTGGEAPSGQGSDTLNGLRSGFIRTMLANSQAGARLLSAADKPSPAGSPPITIRRWWTLGPFDSTAYGNPPVKPGAIDTQKPVGPHAWVQVDAKADDTNCVFDLKATASGYDAVMFCYAEIPASADGAATLLMRTAATQVVWLNGVRVYEEHSLRRPFFDSQVPVMLKKGVNHLLCVVQNNASSFSIQGSVVENAWQFSEMGKAIQLALGKPDQRDSAATTLGDAISGAYNGGMIAEAGELTRILLGAFPDRWEPASAIAWRFTTDPRLLSRDPATARQALLWLEGSAPLQSQGGQANAWLGEVRRSVAKSLIQIGDYDSAVDILHAAMWQSFDTLSQCQYRMSLGAIYRNIGSPERATAYYKSVQDTDGIDQLDPALANQARAALTELRQLNKLNKLNQVNVITFDSTTAVRSVDLLAESKDYDGAITAARKLALANPGSAVPQGKGRSLGLATWYADHLRRMPAAEIEACHAKVGEVAKRRLTEAISRDDVDALERLTNEFPLFPETAEALGRCARHYLALGADSLAAATVDRLMREFTVDEPVRGELLIAGLRAAARAGDRAVFANLAKEFTATPPPMVDGVAIDAKAWLAETGKQFAPQSDPVQLAAIGTAPLALTPEQLRDIRRFVGDGERTAHVVPSVGIGAGLAYLDSGVDGVLLDLASGAPRWRTANDRMPITGAVERGFGGLPEAGAIIAGGRCVARARREGRWILEARDPLSGALIWSSELTPELLGWGACSSPASDGARVIAVFGAGDRLALAAFALDDGHLVWLTPLAMASTDLGLNSKIRTDIATTNRGEWLFDLAAPAIVGREGYVATDSGAVVSFDCGSGFLRWVATYAPLPNLRFEGAQATGERIRRPPSRVLVGADSLAVLPRNAVGLVCFARSDGALRWRRDFPQARALTGLGLTAKGERIVMQGDDVQCLDGATGQTAWRWQPRDGVTIGSGAVGATSVAVSTAGSLHRLDLLTGAPLGSRTWKELGVSGSAPGNLRWAGDRLVAAGNGGIAILAPAAKPVTGLPALVPTVVRSGREAISTSGITPAASGAPLALAWRLPCADIVSVAGPDAAHPREVILQTREAISRVDVAAPAVIWTTAIPADTIGMIVQGDAVLVIGGATLMLINREDGAVRWCEQVGGFNPLGEEVMGWMSGSSVVMGENTVMTFMPGQFRVDFVDLRDRKTGKRLPRLRLENYDDRQYHMGALVVGVAEQGGKICVVFNRNGKAAFQVHDLASGQVIAAHEGLSGFGHGQWATVESKPGGPLLLVSGGSPAVVIEVATGAARTLGFPLPPRIDGIARYDGVFGIWGMNPQVAWERSYTLWDPVSDKAVFQEVFQDNANGCYIPVGDSLVRTINSPDWRVKGGMLCKSRSGQQLWEVPSVGDLGTQRYAYLVGVGTHIYRLVDTRDWYGLAYMDIEVLNAADGKIVATSRVPGAAVTVSGGFQPIGDTWVLAGERQLLGLVPAAPQTVAQLPIDASVPVAQRYLRGLTRLYAAPVTSVMPLSSAKLTDPAEILGAKAMPTFLYQEFGTYIGQPIDALARDRRLNALAATWSSEWSKLPPVMLGPEAVHLGTPAEAKVHVAHHVAGLCIAVEVSDVTPFSRPHGGSYSSGDGVLVGVSGINGFSPTCTVLVLHDSQGLPQIDLVGGSWAADPAQSGKPLLRVLRGSGRQVYQLVIPWALIAHPVRWQPRNLGVAIIDRDTSGVLGVRAWGTGLIDGISPQTWPAIQLLKEK